MHRMNANPCACESSDLRLSDAQEFGPVSPTRAALHFPLIFTLSLLPSRKCASGIEKIRASVTETNGGSGARVRRKSQEEARCKQRRKCITDYYFKGGVLMMQIFLGVLEKF